MTHSHQQRPFQGMSSLVILIFSNMKQDFFTSRTDRGTVCTYRNYSTKKDSALLYFGALLFPDQAFTCKLSTRYHILNWHTNVKFYSDFFERKILSSAHRVDNIPIMLNSGPLHFMPASDKRPCWSRIQ